MRRRYMTILDRRFLSLCLSSYVAKRNGAIPRKKGTVEKILSTGKVPLGMKPHLRITEEEIQEIATGGDAFLQSDA